MHPNVITDDPSQEGKPRFRSASVSLAEATLLATGTSQVLKTSTRRYSPRVYDDTLSIDERSHPESTRSFWSSHTATATAAATSFVVSYWLRHPGSAWRWPVLGGLGATALGVRALTILAAACEHAKSSWIT